MDVSPPNNRSISSGFNASNPPVINNPGLPGDAPIAPPTSTSFFALSGNSSSNVLSAPLMTDSRSEGSQPFGQSFGQTSQTSFTAPGFFAPGPSSNQHAPVPPPVFAGPSSLPSGMPFEAGANQFNPNQFNQSHSNSFNQPNPNQFNQSNPSQFNVNPTSFNQFNSTSFNPDPTSSNPNQFNQSTPNRFNQSTPNQFNQSTPNQFNPSAPSSPFSTPVPNMSSASLASNPVAFTIGTAPPPQLNRYGRPMKKLPQRNRMRQ